MKRLIDGCCLCVALAAVAAAAAGCIHASIGNLH